MRLYTILGEVNGKYRSFLPLPSPMTQRPLNQTKMLLMSFPPPFATICHHFVKMPTFEWNKIRQINFVFIIIVEKTFSSVVIIAFLDFIEGDSVYFFSLFFSPPMNFISLNSKSIRLIIPFCHHFQ